MFDVDFNPGTTKVGQPPFTEHRRQEHIKCHILPFWFIFISPIIFDIIEIYDIFWNSQMKIFFVRNSPKSKIDRISYFWNLNCILCEIFTFSWIIFRIFKFSFRLISIHFSHIHCFVVLTRILKGNFVNFLNYPKFVSVKIFYDFFNFDR